jgi:hypothetical protein
VIDQKYLNAALVEARLRNNQPLEKRTENILSPEYIELSSSKAN